MRDACSGFDGGRLGEVPPGLKVNALVRLLSKYGSFALFDRQSIETVPRILPRVC
jgi:hypothetical protein